MGIRVRNILVFVIILCGLCSCRKEGRVIPRRTMTKIYADMAMTDAVIQNKDYNVRYSADTSLVYEAIFRKYGYTSKDYIASQKAYINDAGRYVRMIKKAVLQLEDDKKQLVAEQKRINELKEKAAGVKRHAPNRIYLMDTLDLADTVWFDFNFQEGLDTAFTGPQMIVWADTVGMSEAKDSLALEPKTSGRKPGKLASKIATQIMKKDVKIQ